MFDVDVGVNLLLGGGGVELLKVRMARGGGHRLSGGENTSMLLKFKLLESFLGEAFWDKYGTRSLPSLPPSWSFKNGKALAKLETPLVDLVMFSITQKKI